ncbi:ATP-binding cassette domain-containing protein [Natrialba swarupiae]|nr:ATP-binding cassette domain-containing protein [Natrialba swarupiae]
MVDWILRKDSDPVQAVDGVSFRLDENESLGVIGESGCGKTTLIETLIGLHEPTSGEILFKGRTFLRSTKATGNSSDVRSR